MTKKGATHHEQPLYSIQALGMFLYKQIQFCFNLNF